VSAREAALGIDVGTTSVKAGLLWLDREEPMLTVGRGYPSRRPRPGWVEQDPAAWLAALGECWAALEELAGPVRIASVGICAQVNTHVLVDETLAPVGPAITWQDIRAAPEAAELDARADPHRDAWWGGPFRIDASFALARLLWLERHEPESRRRARWLLSPRDVCLSALTGRVVTDPITPVGLVGPDDRYIGGVLDLVDGAERLMPPIHPLDSPAGTVLEGNAPGLPPGIPVAVGTMDAWGSVVGTGLVRAGRAMELAGTSEVVAVASDRSVPTEGIIALPPVAGLRVHAGPTQAGGAALEWMARCLGRTVDDVLALAEDGRRDPQPVVFLPHLAGERAPYWDPDARGVFIGLASATEDRHLALAVLEGVAFSARLVLESCEVAADRRADDIRLAGGGARSSLWNQLKASVHGRPMNCLATLDSGVLGAALIGIVGTGIGSDLAALADSRATIASVVDPEPAEQARLDDLYAVYRETYTALRPVFGRLATVG
jgi:xylulokinase